MRVYLFLVGYVRKLFSGWSYMGAPQFYKLVLRSCSLTLVWVTVGLFFVFLIFFLCMGRGCSGWGCGGRAFLFFVRIL